MYVQIVTYNLNGVSEQDYIDIAHQVAAQFNSMPGLHAKVWLSNPEENSYGAVYFWEDREYMERFTRSDLFEGTYPGFSNVASRGYDVYEHLTKANQPMLTILEEEEGWTAASAAPVEAPAPPPPPEAPSAPARKATKAPARKATKAPARKATKATKSVTKVTKARKVTKVTKVAKGAKGAKKSGRTATGPRKATARSAKKSTS